MSLYDRIAESFGRMGMMRTIGAELTVVEPGRVEIALPRSEAVTQQNGFFHAGAITTIADTAGGYAAFTTMPEGTDVLAVEFKINLLSPAAGDMLRAVGEVVKAGRTLVVTTVDIFSCQDGEEKLCARMQQTCIRMS